MTTFELIKRLENENLFMPAVKAGLISISYLDYKNIYLTFKKYRVNNNKMDSYQFTANDHNISSDSVRRIVKTLLT